MGLLEMAKEHIGKLSIIGVLTFTTSVVGTAILVDDRYAHAATLEKQFAQLETQSEINRLQQEVSNLELRRSSLQDKIIESGSKQGYGQKLTQAEVFNLERYRSELVNINATIERKSALIDELKAGKVKP